KLMQAGYSVPETYDYETPLDALNDNNYIDRDHSWLILGDSHAQALAYALKQALKEQEADLLAPYNKGCPYVRHMDHFTPQHKEIQCAKNSETLHTLVNDLKPRTVVVMNRLPLFIEQTRYDNGEGGVEPGGPLSFKDSSGEHKTMQQRTRESIEALLAR